MTACYVTAVVEVVLRSTTEVRYQRRTSLLDEEVLHP